MTDPASPSKLRTDPALAEPDELFAALVDLHQGLDLEASLLASNRLVLLLANHIGDLDVVREAIATARRAAREGA